MEEPVKDPVCVLLHIRVNYQSYQEFSAFLIVLFTTEHFVTLKISSLDKITKHLESLQPFWFYLMKNE